MSGKIAERVVLDSYAVLALLGGEASGRRVLDALNSGDAWMTLVNLGEVAYIVERARGRQAADDVYANLLAPDREGAVNWLPVDAALVRHAASLKAVGGLSYADCFAAAAAGLLQCPVLTGDPEFRIAEKAGITVERL